MTPNPLTTEEKFWAVLAHLAAWAGGVGLLVTVYGWIENRKKSNYAAYHSLQALCYQSLGYTLWAVVYLVVLIILSIFTLPSLLKSLPTGTSNVGPWVEMHALIVIVLFGLYLFLTFVAAVACGLGRDFAYPFIGGPLAGYIGYEHASGTDLDEARADRVAISMGHFCVIFPLWGLFVPLAILTTQGARSRFIRFQALQTIVFQIAGGLITLILTAISLAVLVVALVPLTMARNLMEPPIESLFGALIFLICLAVLTLVVPLLQVLGQWAGLRILQGHDYRYPIIGRLVENRLARWEAAREAKRA